MDIKKLNEGVNVDLDSIADPVVKNFVIKLLNIIEALAIENKQLRAENEWLKDENNRLKGGQDQTPSLASLIKTRSDLTYDAG